MKLQPRIFFSHFLQDKRRLLVLIEVSRSIDTSLSFPSKAKNSTQLQTTAKPQSALPPTGRSDSGCHRLFSLFRNTAEIEAPTFLLAPRSYKNASSLISALCSCITAQKVTDQAGRRVLAAGNLGDRWPETPNTGYQLLPVLRLPHLFGCIFFIFFLDFLTFSKLLPAESR